MLTEMLDTLQSFPLGEIASSQSRYTQLLAEVMKRVYADRARYIGDPAAMRTPYQALLTPEHIESIRKTINQSRSTHRERFSHRKR